MTKPKSVWTYYQAHGTFARVDSEGGLQMSTPWLTFKNKTPVTADFVEALLRQHFAQTTQDKHCVGITLHEITQRQFVKLRKGDVKRLRNRSECIVNYYPLK